MKLNSCVFCENGGSMWLYVCVKLTSTSVTVRVVGLNELNELRSCVCYFYFLKHKGKVSVFLVLSTWQQSISCLSLLSSYMLSCRWALRVDMVRCLLPVCEASPQFLYCFQSSFWYYSQNPNFFPISFSSSKSKLTFSRYIINFPFSPFKYPRYCLCCMCS